MRFSRFVLIPAIVAACVITSVRASDTDGGPTSIVAHEDFLSGTNGTMFVAGATGVGSSGNSQDDATKERPGIIRLKTGATATGRGSIITGAACGIRFGGGEWTYEADVEVVGLSNATQGFVIRQGFLDSQTNLVPSDGAWIEYDDATSANWLLCSADNGSVTRTASGVAVTAGWHRGKVVVAADASIVTYTMDGTALGTVTTDIPSNDGRSTGVGVSIYKTAGLIDRNARIDWIDVRVTLTNSR